MIDSFSLFASYVHIRKLINIIELYIPNFLMHKTPGGTQASSSSSKQKWKNFPGWGERISKNKGKPRALAVVGVILNEFYLCIYIIIRSRQNDKNSRGSNTPKLRSYQSNSIPHVTWTCKQRIKVTATTAALKLVDTIKFCSNKKNRSTKT